MSELRIGVPPGVGDVYWCLCKLRAFREFYGVDRVTLCVQQTSKPRALEWAQMVDTVDEAIEVSFRPSDQTLSEGVGGFEQIAERDARGRRTGRIEDPKLSTVLWPNAVVDRGEHLSTWLPHLPLDLNIDIRTAPAPAGRVIVYASAEPTNRAWLPRLGAYFWRQLIGELGARTGIRPTLVGSEWDAEFRDSIAAADVEDLVGQTSLRDVAGLIKGARVVVGLISGMTILANHFRVPTIALYPDKHHPMFPRAWVAADAPYMPIANAAVPPAPELARLACSMLP